MSYGKLQNVLISTYINNLVNFEELVSAMNWVKLIKHISQFISHRHFEAHYYFYFADGKASGKEGPATGPDDRVRQCQSCYLGPAPPIEKAGISIIENISFAHDTLISHSGKGLGKEKMFCQINLEKLQNYPHRL